MGQERNLKHLLYENEDFFLLTFSYITSEVIYRILLIIKEICFYYKHYPMETRYFTIIKYGFQFNNRIKMLLLNLIIFYAIMISTDMTNILILFKNYDKYLKLIPIYMTFRYFKLNESYIDTAEWIRSDTGLDYATGMASNYFHGYLHLVLPDKGDNIEDIRRRMNKYMDENKVEFAITRLFILVPDSLHTTPQIKSEILESAKCLETTVKGRAGVKRPFKNAVYRFTEKINDKNYYVAVEGATPLLSFLEAINFSITSTPEMKAMRREILFQFYKSVKKFTQECRDTKNTCEIVYYNDSDEVDVGYVLKRHIEKMLEEGKS